jgi:hypothetical protein
MSILDQTVLPIGIPPYFVADALAPGASAAQLLSWASGSLLSEYARAQGHVFEWDHIIEDHAGAPASGCICWRVIPLRLWYETDNMRQQSPLSVAQFIPRLHISVRELLRDVLPEGVFLTGGDRNRCDYHHHLFALLAMGDRIREHRRWFDREFIPQHLPPVLSRLTIEIAQLCKFEGSTPLLPHVAEASPQSLAEAAL